MNKKENIKIEIIKAVSVVVCIAMVCSDMLYCIDKINQTQSEINRIGRSVYVQAQDEAQSVYGGEIALDSETASDVSENNDVEAVPDVQALFAEKSETDENTQSAEQQSPLTKAEILSFFNTAVNRVKGSAKSIYQSKQYVYKYRDIDLGKLGFLSEAVNNLIESNVGDIESKTDVTAVTAEEKEAMFPVANETWSSKLTVSDIKSADIQQTDSSYIVKISIFDDEPSAETIHGQGHHGKAFSIQLTQNVKDKAGVAGSILSGLKIGYSNGTITAQIDKNSGNISKIIYDYVWTLYVPASGGITAPFGTTQEFYIKW